jgi:hypothetical protein
MLRPSSSRCSASSTTRLPASVAPQPTLADSESSPSLVGQAAPAPAPGRPGRPRPEDRTGRSRGRADLPVRSRRPLPAAAGAGRLGPRRGRQADPPWPACPSPGVLARRDRRGPPGPANLSDLAIAEDLLDGVSGWTLADRHYGSPRLATQLHAHRGWLLAPPGGRSRPQQRLPPWLVGKRRRVERGHRAVDRPLSPQAGLGLATTGTCRPAGCASCSATPWRCSGVSEPASAPSGSPTSSPTETRTPG